MSCPFCDTEALRQRTFYQDANWLALLAAPPHTRGHTILAAAGRPEHCPRDLDQQILSGLGAALAQVIRALQTHFQPKDVLFASLRGSEGHVHLHLIPLWAEEESAWRDSHADPESYRKGHLMEYLGYLEQRGEQRAANERHRTGWSEDEQREHLVKQPQFQSDVAALRASAERDLPADSP